jgi:hypothetical protein
MVGLYTAGLAMVFAAALGVGRAIGPVGTASSSSSHSADEGHTGEHGTPSTEAASDDLQADGLAVSQAGYTLRLSTATIAPGLTTSFTFTVLGPDGLPLTRYTRTHDKDLHLILSRRDLTQFQHVHPTRRGDGTWTVPLHITEAGPYKVFADFTPAGLDRSIVLAADLSVPGNYTPSSLPAASSTTSVDGVDVAVQGRLVAGTSSKLTFTLRTDGKPVTDLQPYLGAFGHLVALREGDLAYLHVHPDGGHAAGGNHGGPEITFFADVPTAGAYRLFLDFQQSGVVHTATVTATAAPHQGAR